MVLNRVSSGLSGLWTYVGENTVCSVDALQNGQAVREHTIKRGVPAGSGHISEFELRSIQRPQIGSVLIGRITGDGDQLFSRTCNSLIRRER